MAPPAPYGHAVERPTHWVIAGGLVTTALTLAAVRWLAAHADFQVMGWHLNYVIPAGALLAGIAAGSGYGIVSWLTGVKITRELLWLVVALLVAGYFAARYVEFRELELHGEKGEAVGFLTYLDWDARSFAWQKKDGSPGEPLGLWGYAFNLLELVGFAAGGLLVPAVLREQPYCEACQLYLRKKALGLLPAGVVPRKLKKRDDSGRAAYEAERAEAWARGQALVAELAGCVAAGRAADAGRLIEDHASRQKEYAKLERRIELTFATCPSCRTGHLAAVVLEGKGDKVRKTPLARYDVAAGFTTDFLNA